MRKRYEWHRTCNRCKRTWYAPIEKKPTKFDIGTMRLQASGQSLTTIGRFGSGGSARARAVQMQEQRERVEAAERCPSCGSGSFEQQKVRVD